MEKQDLIEFKRLRNYYRRNFTNGESDEAFVLWCEGICEKLSNQTLIQTPAALDS